MRKFIVIAVLLLITLQAHATFTAQDYLDGKTYLGSGNKLLDPLYLFIVDSVSADTVGKAFFFYIPGTEPDDIEGYLYYDAAANTLKLRNNSGFVALATAAGNSLDQSYDAGSGITADDGAVTITVTDNSNNTGLTVDQNDATNDADGVLISQAGAGDALQIEPQDTDSGGINVVAKASGTVPLVILDGSTNNIDLADNKGQLLIQADDPYIHAGATGLMILDSSTPIVAAEGFLARFVHSGSARASTSAVEIEVPATQTALAVNSQVIFTVQGNSSKTTLNVVGNDGTNNTHALDVHNEGTAAAVLITPDDTDTPALLVTGKANSSVTVVTIDGASGDWIGGADDVAMVEITGGSTANADAGGGLLAVISATTPAASSEGFLARFIHPGTATATAHAVEIECTNAQPALMLNNRLTITGVDSTGVLVAITGNDDTGDTDVMTIANGAASDGIQITNSDVSSVALNLIATASQITPTVIVDGSTNNWDGADDKGQVLIQTDDPFIHAGATALMILDSSTPINSAEGFLARFVHSGTAKAGTSAVEIEVPATQQALAANGLVVFTQQNNSGGTLLSVVGVAAGDDEDAMLISLTGAGNCLQVTPGEADTGGINITSLASSTVSMITLDGASNNWDGADDVGQLILTQDDAVVHTGATQLLVINGGTTVAAAEGFLARFVQHTGAAVTDAYAVEIETTATTPCLKLNGQMSIAGQGATDGVLLDIVSADTDNDTVQLTGVGTADVLQVTANATTATGIHVVGVASSTVSLQKIIGDAGAGWLGASDVGMLHLTNDGALASVNASLLFINNTGIPTNDSRGSCLRIIDTGNAGGGTAGYAVFIKATDATVEALYVDEGEVLIDEILTTGIGYQSTVVTKVANSDGGSGSTIVPGTRVVHVTGFTANANDWILLPSGTIGQRLTIISDVAHEIRTPAASDDTINDVDADGGANEYQVTLDDINDFVCTGTGASWIAVAHDKLGAAKTVAPDGV